MLRNIIRIAILCIVLGSASIPLSFQVNSSPFVVWFGNALGSLASAMVVIYIGDRITDKRFKDKAKKHRVSRKMVNAFETGDDNKHVQKVAGFVNKHGLRLFAFFCPIFPGVTISTVAVYIFDLDKKTYKRWMLAGVFFVSGAYVFAYWFTFVKPH